MHVIFALRALSLHFTRRENFRELQSATTEINTLRVVKRRVLVADFVHTNQKGSGQP